MTLKRPNNTHTAAFEIRGVDMGPYTEAAGLYLMYVNVAVAVT